MKRLFLFLLLLSVMALSFSCHVEKDYDLKDIDYEINAGQQLLVPIGSFPTIKIGDLLSKNAKNYFNENEEGDYLFDSQGKTLTDFELGHYEIHGLSFFVSLVHFKIPHIKFYIKVKNSLPFAFELSSHVLDENRNPVEGISAIVDASIPAGTEENPAYGDAVINISSNLTEDGFGFDGFNIILKVKQMPSSAMAVSGGVGLALKDVRLQLPDGITFRIKKKNNSDE